MSRFSDAEQYGRWGRDAACAFALVGLALLAYRPTFGMGYIWDDDDYVLNNDNLRTNQGLADIWLKPLSIPQYYPLVHTTFWLEYQIWRDKNPGGFHFNNALLHGLCAALAWAALRRLRAPGAWLAAAIFAAHPVHVESVAWITERKNVLSGAFYLGAFLAYMSFDGLDAGEREPRRERRWRFYGLAWLLFICALLSKTVTFTLPIAALAALWWKRGRIGLRDMIPALPMLAVGIAMGALTAWLEKHHVGTGGMKGHFGWSPIERVLIASRAPWFYLWKLAWPSHLMFFYPQWKVDAARAWLYLFPLGGVGLVALLWGMRGRIGRGPLAAAAFFVATLGPALGFIDVAPMRFSIVADHFQYLASLGPIALGAAGAAILWERRPACMPPRLGALAAGFGVVGLMALASRQTLNYKDEERLWETLLVDHPKSVIALINLGQTRAMQGATARENAKELKVRGREAEAKLLDEHATRRFETALEFQKRALEIEPRSAIAYNNMGMTYVQLDQPEKAKASFEKALDILPRYANPRVQIGLILSQKGDKAGAMAEYQKALDIDSGSPLAHFALGHELHKLGRLEEAIAHYDAALQTNPSLMLPMMAKRAAEREVEEKRAKGAAAAPQP